MMITLITDEIFRAFLVCETKAHLKSSGYIGSQREFTEWELSCLEGFRQKCLVKLRSSFRADEYLLGLSSPQNLKNSNYRLIADCVLQTQELQSYIHALERSITLFNEEQNPFIPIRFIPNEKITRNDKLLLSFDAVVLSIASGKMPLFGKIIHGVEQRIVKVELVKLVEITKALISKITTNYTNTTPPQLILNKHCSKCEFQPQCHQIAIEKDELTLLSGMTEKERRRQHNKGIFSVTQLSYTFRARRKPKRLASKPNKYSHALKALAIREHKIYVAGKLEFNIQGNPVFLDVEGNPDQDFYYLIGLRIKCGDLYAQHSYWANERSDEEKTWTLFLKILSKIDNPRLICYGHYEKVFLNRMKERYPVTVNNTLFLDRLIAESVNILSVVYAQIYFPTYSNGLKEIAQYLGFQWSDKTASGLNTLIWRAQREFSKDPNLKQKLITYNAEDCEALEIVTNTVTQLCQKQADVPNSEDNNVVYTNSLKRESPYHLGRNKFLMPDFEYINQAAYWDYQRDKIYVRSNKKLKSTSKKANKNRAKDLPIDEVVECQPPAYCPKCKAIDIRKYEKTSKILYDLKFGQASIKRWIVKYNFYRYMCYDCKVTFYSKQRYWTRSKFGQGFIAYIIYQNIELRLSQEIIAQSINQLFGFNFDAGMFNNQKTRVAHIYKETYDEILKKIVHGKLIHADETKVSIKGEIAYAWIFTSLEEVIYLYRETRDGDFLQELLREFNGVLVSDFYAAYDSVNCPQQKCLVHLMRDLNDDLFKYPFDEEFKELVRGFAMLLKPIIETIDRFGLKADFLKNHKVFVESFYKKLSNFYYKSEAELKYKKRFEKYHGKLFTFLDYDGIPWNNNNAEHTIKSFAMLRKVIGGTSTANGIREYLTLFSICETCKYKGVSFLDFLRSGEKNIDAFINKQETK